MAKKGERKTATALTKRPDNWTDRRKPRPIMPTGAGQVSSMSGTGMGTL